MNIADVSLAIGTGLAAGVVITGILIITWFLCVNYPAARDAKPFHDLSAQNNKLIYLGEFER